MRDYPVLFRSLYMRTINWVDYTVELLSRLSKDWDLIRGKSWARPASRETDGHFTGSGRRPLPGSRRRHSRILLGREARIQAA